MLGYQDSNPQIPLNRAVFGSSSCLADHAYVLVAAFSTLNWAKLADSTVMTLDALRWSRTRIYI
jgi:hypothetical protein